MTLDGISTEDWDRVYEAAIEIVNASAIEGDVLCSHHTERLFDLLSELEGRYGRIPSILATRADFTHDLTRALALHEEALSVASDSTSTRLSLQSMIGLMIDENHPDSEIFRRLEALEQVTEVDGCPFDLDELKELQEDFERKRAAPKDRPGR